LSAVGVHEKSELQQASLEINYVWFANTQMSAAIGFRGSLFFWVSKRKERGWHEEYRSSYLETDE